jgi:integrase
LTESKKALKKAKLPKTLLKALEVTMVSPFTIIERTYSSGRKVFMARFLNSDGTILRTVALSGINTRAKAIREADRQLKEGVVSSDDNPFALDFFAEFWKLDSLYIRSRSRQGTEISHRYIEQSANLVVRRFGKALRGKRMKDLSVLAIEKAIDAMELKGVGRRSINMAVQAVRVPVAWWARMHNVPNPLANVGKLKEEPKARGALSSAEVGALIALSATTEDVEKTIEAPLTELGTGDKSRAKKDTVAKDDEPRFKAAVLLGCLCGLRMGEVRGLLWEDIDFEKNLIHVCHNIPSGEDALKAPKSGSTRTVPAPEVVIDSLRLIQAMPGHGERFVVYNARSKDRPATIAGIRNGFARMLKRIGVDETMQTERNIVFHGLRHSFVSLSRAAGVPDFLVQRLAGHKTAKMMENYSHSENVIDFSKAAEGMAKVLADAASEAKKAAAGGKA